MSLTITKVTVKQDFVRNGPDLISRRRGRHDHIPQLTVVEVSAVSQDASLPDYAHFLNTRLRGKFAGLHGLNQGLVILFGLIGVGDGKSADGLGKVLSLATCRSGRFDGSLKNE